MILPFPRQMLDHADEVHHDWILIFATADTVRGARQTLYSLTQEDSCPDLVSGLRYPEGCHCPVFFRLLPVTKKTLLLLLLLL